MEYTSKKCSTARRDDRINLFDDLINVCSQNSLSAEPDSLLHPLKFTPKSPRRKKAIGHSHQKRDYLTRLFEKKKLKDKSLSKRMKTPFDRKLNRTCWPIQLGKVSKIKKKPREKRKGKPTQRSLRRKKFSNPTFINSRAKTLKRRSPSICSSGSELLDEESFDELYHTFKANHFLFEPITPQILMDILQDPEHIISGATIDTITTKLRTMKLHFNRPPEFLKEEVMRTLGCAVKLGLVKKNKGFYRIAHAQMNKLPKKKLKNNVREILHRNWRKVKR